MASFPPVSPPELCIKLFSPPYALHAPPISFFLIIQLLEVNCLYRMSQKIWWILSRVGGSMCRTEGSRSRIFLFLSWGTNKNAAPAYTKWQQSKNFFIKCPSEQENESVLETWLFLHKIMEWWLWWTKSKICLNHCFIIVYAHKYKWCNLLIKSCCFLLNLFFFT